jgi:hypothetical protein
VHAVERQDDHDDKVGDQERGVEEVPAVEVFEGGVGVVGVEVVLEAALDEEAERRWVCWVEKGEQGTASAWDGIIVELAAGGFDRATAGPSLRSG